MAYFYFDFKDTEKQDSRASVTSLLIYINEAINPIPYARFSFVCTPHTVMARSNRLMLHLSNPSKNDNDCGNILPIYVATLRTET